MSISTTTNTAQFSCDGTQTEFDLAVKIFESSDVVVYVKNSTTGEQTTLTETTDYSMLPISDDYTNGARVTTNSAYSSSFSITLSRTMENTQELSLSEGGDFPSDSMEDALDKIVMQIQQLSKQLEATLQAPETDSEDLDYTIPASDTRALEVLGFDEDGNITTYDSDDFANLTLSKLKVIAYSGETSERPTTLDEDDAMKVLYMDTDLGYPLFWNGSDWSNFSGVSGL